jgi:uncharacterized membrane protein YccF (DUF307 family)
MSGAANGAPEISGHPMPTRTGSPRLRGSGIIGFVIRLVLNVLWLIFGGGLILAAGYGIAALICFALVVTIPFGVASLRLAVYSLWPFGRTLVTKPSAGLASGAANVIWVIVAGWWLALSHIIAGIGLCVTVIGIPFGIANFKLVPAAFWPLGREVVDQP